MKYKQKVVCQVEREVIDVERSIREVDEELDANQRFLLLLLKIFE